MYAAIKINDQSVIQHFLSGESVKNERMIQEIMKMRFCAKETIRGFSLKAHYFLGCIRGKGIPTIITEEDEIFISNASAQVTSISGIID